MTQDAYWDELGLAWTAINPAPETVAPRLQARLRRQAALLAAILLAGIPLSLAGMALGAWTVWLGASTQAWFFVTRGIAIFTMSLLAGFATWSFRSTMVDPAHSLGAMIALALLRAERWRRAVRLAGLGLAIAALFGSAGYIIRIQVGKPSAMSLAPALIVLTVLGLVLFLLHRKASDDIAKYRYLKRLLLEEPR